MIAYHCYRTGDRLVSLTVAFVLQWKIRKLYITLRCLEQGKRKITIAQSAVCVQRVCIVTKIINETRDARESLGGPRGLRIQPPPNKYMAVRIAWRCIKNNTKFNGSPRNLLPKIFFWLRPSRDANINFYSESRYNYVLAGTKARTNKKIELGLL